MSKKYLGIIKLEDLLFFLQKLQEKMNTELTLSYFAHGVSQIIPQKQRKDCCSYLNGEQIDTLLTLHLVVWCFRVIFLSISLITFQENRSISYLEMQVEVLLLDLEKIIRHALIIVVHLAQTILKYVTGTIITLCNRIQKYYMVHWLVARETAPVITKTAGQVTLVMRCHLIITLDFSRQLQVYCQNKNKVTVGKCKINFNGIFQVIYVLQIMKCRKSTHVNFTLLHSCGFDKFLAAWCTQIQYTWCEIYFIQFLIIVKSSK